MKINHMHWVLSVVFCLLLMNTHPAKSNEQGVNVLLEQLSFQMGQRNLFQAEKTLSKISKVAPNNLIYLQENIRFLAESARFDEARVSLLKIKTRLSVDEYNVLLQLLNIYQNNREVLSEARLLNTRKLYKEALDKYDGLFQSKDPHYSLALEYWDIITEVQPELEPTVLYKLEKLSKQYPANTRIKLAYFKYSLRAGLNKLAIYQELYLLTFNTVWQFEAKRLWQYGLLNTEVTESNKKGFLDYLERFPNDTWITYHYQDGLDAIKQHNILMRDPAYRAKIKLPIMLDNDDPLPEISLALETAKTKYANDQVVVISEGRLLFRKKDFNGAIAAFNRCIELFVPTPSVCVSLIRTTEYWALIDHVERDIVEQNFESAQDKINELYKFEDESNYHILLDGRLHETLGDLIIAEQLYLSLLALDPLSRQVLVTIMEFKLNHYGKLNMDTWVSGLSLQQTNVLLSDYHALLIARIREKADARLLEGNEQDAEALLLSGLQIVQMHPWVTYDLARLYISQGDVTKALNLYQPISDKVEVKYSHSLILASLDMYDRAINVLKSIPPESRTESVLNDISDYEFALAMMKVDEATQHNRLSLLLRASDVYSNNLVYMSKIQQKMFQYGFLEQTVLLASALADSNLGSEVIKRVDVLLRLAQVQLITKQTDQAIDTLTQVYAEDDRSLVNNLDLADLSIDLLEQGDLPTQLDVKLTSLLDSQTSDYPNLADVWADNLRVAEVNQEPIKMWEALSHLVKLEPSQSYRFYQLFSLYEDHQDTLDISEQVFKDDYLIPFIQMYPFNPVGYDFAYRLYYRLPELNEDANSLMKKGYYTALMTDIGDPNDFDVRSFTTGDELIQQTATSDLSHLQKQKIQEYYDLMNSNERISKIEVNQGSWLVNRFQTAVREHSEKQNQRLELGVKQYSKSGGQGSSEYDLSVLSLTYAAPMDNAWLGMGEWYIKIDPTILNAGVLDVSDPANDTFGTIALCDDPCDNLLLKQERSGFSIALGFENESFIADIGTKPIGFELVDWVGGINYNNSIWNIGWSIGASKRPVTSSLLSYSGTEDPNSSIIWGGVSLYNMGLSLSYDQGTGWGIWALADAGAITGTEIKSNQRTRAMGGVYLDWFNRDWLTASIGLNLFTWQYQDDLSQFTLGQGGYYSPQKYMAASIPLNFYGRLGDFTYQVDLSISRSESGDDETMFYPNHPEYQAAFDLVSSDSFSGGDTKGQGYSANAMIEYKLTNHWTFGTNLTIQKSEFFSPNSLYFYLKYYFEPNLQPANRRPDPVSIYMDY
ncbi:cellulose synthase subunit BcsC-related outer membrane protein [uncultured Psychrosphaera sp.]|uniref:cellulose synthase subunit BcsC-related outer membrane protein n=1 Tax=uncultured Psychrosphaera sp. TaxID=1403522 RepID=UPI0030F58E8C